MRVATHLMITGHNAEGPNAQEKKLGSQGQILGAKDRIVQDSQLNTISNFIWNTADSILRSVFVRGKFRDVILPMTVIRRLDAVLEPTKQKVLDEKKFLDEAGITDQEGPLREAAGQQFYNASPFTLRSLLNANSPQQLKDDFNAYLDGFSSNVQEIIGRFQFRLQLETLTNYQALHQLIERYLTPTINFSPNPILNEDESVRLAGLDNHAMGTIFEDLLRRFNEENNEEAGEHWTPRDAVELMAKLVFVPIEGQILPTTYTLYDGAIGTGGMMTVAEQTLQEIAETRGQKVSTHLYGQEINSETYAICKADLLIKGEENTESNIVGGPEYSTLSNDVFKEQKFDFMLSNPPYGKDWKMDLGKMGGKKGISDPRFIILHNDNPEYSLVTRVSDGQLLFLANMASKMKENTPLGSRIAEVHNGSSLFTGDAGQGESNIRRWIIENDWLEAIVALPLNMFYNTGIATYVWVITNRKAEHRKGHIQLIDATQWYRPLRRNMGQKNCELGDEDIQKICDVFMAFEETEQSKIFPNEAFGYWKVIVERPLRLAVELSPDHCQHLRDACLKAKEEPLANLVDRVATTLGYGPHTDFNRFMETVAADASEHGVKLTAKRKNLLQTVLAYRDETAEPVIKKIHMLGEVGPDPIHGLIETDLNGQSAVVEYEPDSELRDTEQIPLLHEGGIDAFLEKEVLPYAPDVWYSPAQVKVGYEISFTRHFYKPKPMRTLEEIRADILALERESEGLLEGILAR